MSFFIIKNLNFTYPGNGFSLKNINLEIKKGESIGFIGPNAAGKTTLLKILCGIIEDFSGEILIENQNIKKLSIKERARKISYVPQIFDGIFDFTVEEIIYMGRRPFSNSIGVFNENDKFVVDDILKKFNLIKKKNKKFFMLSGGEKKIALIIRAICQDTDILIFDEPLAYLDLHHQIEFVKIINELNNKQKTILLVSHDINFAAEICQKIILLNNGKIIKYGRPEEILNKKLIKSIYNIKDFDININPVSDKPNILIMYKNKIKG